MSQIYLRSHRKKLKIIMAAVKWEKKYNNSNPPGIHFLKASRWGWKRFSFLLYPAVKACMNYKNGHRWNHSCDAVLNQNPNKQSSTMLGNLVRSCISFRGGSWKTWKVKIVKWKTWVLGKENSSSFVFTHQYSLVKI